MTSIQKNIDRILEGNKGCAPMNHIAINQSWKRSGAYGNVRRAKLTGKSRKFIALKEMKVKLSNKTHFLVVQIWNMFTLTLLNYWHRK